jgi:FkbM family methyltransferase
MKLEYGVWLPDNEKHLVDMLSNSTLVDGRGTYQLHKLNAALEHVEKFRVAADVGMHVGLWAMHLVKRFSKVVGFEPVAEHIECLRRNMNDVKNWEVYNCALGDRVGSVGLRPMKGSTGSTQIDPEIDSAISMRRLDEFEFSHLDFIKIDVECYEYFVVKGGEQTLRKHKPVVIVEQKGGKLPRKLNYGQDAFAAKELLESWGARTLFEIKGDYCLAWG